MKSNSQLKPHSKWMPATIVLIVVTMVTTMLEPSAFARNGNEAPKSEEQVAERTAPAALPNRQVLVASAAFALPQGQPRPATSLTRPTASAPAPQSKGKSKKWIWIAAAAGAGAVTAIILARGGSEEAATITIGSPIVGSPQ